METTRPYPKVEPPTLGTLAAEPGLAARYELLGAVAHGGMGAVFRARHKGLEMPVAIKVMLAGAPPERFLREARLLARITSPFVVGVRDFEMHHGVRIDPFHLLERSSQLNRLIKIVFGCNGVMGYRG